MFSAEAARGADRGGVTVRGGRRGGGVAHALHEALEGAGQRVRGDERVQAARALAVGVLVQRHGGADRAPAAEGRAPHQRRAATHADDALLP